jgi:hypothetical protein
LEVRAVLDFVCHSEERRDEESAFACALIIHKSRSFAFGSG